MRINPLLAACCLVASFQLNAQDSKALPPDFIWVEGGIFKMGCDPKRDPTCRKQELPLHKVKLKGFAMAKYELRWEEFEAFVKATGYQTTAELRDTSAIYRPEDGKGSWQEEAQINWRHDYRGQAYAPSQAKGMPVLHVSWLDGLHYCNWLNSQAGLPPMYVIEGDKISWNPSNKGYRLPTEAEWEYAARGGANSKNYTYAGSNDIEEVAWYGVNSNQQPHSVGLKKPNELGFYDLSGNVWEPCWDVYDEMFFQSKAARDNPTGPAWAGYRVTRGGDWLFPTGFIRIAYRNETELRTTSGNQGLRIVYQP